MSDLPLVTILDDEPDIREILSETLEDAGFRTMSFGRAREFEAALKSLKPDVCLVDLSLPDKDGLTLVHRLALEQGAIVIIISGRAQVQDKVTGLELGADDYITKPFNPRELTIRARNLLTRSMNQSTAVEDKKTVERYAFNGWTVEINSRSLVSPSGESYKLPRSEFRALLHFCENPGKIQTRADLLKKMTGRELKPHDRTVDVTIRRIRKHFESVTDTPEIIATIHGEGYRFCGDLEEL